MIVVRDSKEGWAKAYRQLLALLWAGEIPKWDVSKVRPAGSRLKTFGGRASGPAPLVELFNFTVTTFKLAQGRKLSSMECHDLMCFIGQIVVVGGVRRSAMISLSNLSDDRMRHAKSGQWWETAPHRALANNSVSYTEKPDIETFMREWTALVESKSGEEGYLIVKHLKNKLRSMADEIRIMSLELILAARSYLGRINFVTLLKSWFVQLIRWKISSVKSSWLRFLALSIFLHPISISTESLQRNTEEERLLGVSLTGIMDNPLMTAVNANLEKTLNELRTVAVDTNAEYAELLGIPQSAAITCVKPSGTVSQLVDSASGIHARHSPYYIRTVRGDNKDPLTQFMIDSGVPNEPCVFKGDTTTVFSFPVKSPENAVTRNDMTAIEQLETWLTYQRHWCEHKPSVTISVRDDEWLDVGAFVYKHFDEMSGVSFLPHSDHTYQQAPYQDCSKEEYMNYSVLCRKRLTGVSFQSMNKKITRSRVKHLLALVTCVKS